MAGSSAEAGGLANVKGTFDMFTGTYCFKEICGETFQLWRTFGECRFQATHFEETQPAIPHHGLEFHFLALARQ